MPTALCTLVLNRLTDGWNSPAPKHTSVRLGVLTSPCPDIPEPVCIGCFHRQLAPEVVGNANMRDRFRDDTVLFEPLLGEKALIYLVGLRCVLRIGLTEHQSMMGKVMLGCALRVKVVGQCGIGVDARKIGWGDFVWELCKELLLIREDKLLIVGAHDE